MRSSGRATVDRRSGVPTPILLELSLSRFLPFVPIPSLVAACLFTMPALAASERHALDPSHTTVAFLVEHVGFARTLGRFTEVEGEFAWDPDTRELSDVRIVVATASVATDDAARDKHVRSEDFLSVKAHPEMVFELSGPVAVDADGTRLDGTLTLRGQTRPLALDVTLNKSDTYPFGHEKATLGISARGALARSDYGMEYAVANGLVGDEVELLIETEAPRAE